MLESEAQVSVEKENHWKAELSHISTQLELSQQKVFQLESELGRKEGELDEVSANLRKAQRFQDLAREEVRERSKVAYFLGMLTGSIQDALLW